MSCILEEQNGKVNVVLSFKREQLLYDIKNCAYAEGHVMPPDVGHKRHMVTDIGEEGNVDRVTRILDLEIAKVREMLYPYTKHDIKNPTLNNDFKERKVYGVIMSVPAHFSQTTLTLLERLIHEYLVCRALQDWMSIVNPDKVEAWAIKAAEAEDELRVTLNSRMSRTRIRPHWL